MAIVVGIAEGFAIGKSKCAVDGDSSEIDRGDTGSGKRKTKCWIFQKHLLDEIAFACTCLTREKTDGSSDVIVGGG